LEIKFSDFKYERPDLTSIEKEFNLLLTEFKNGKSANGQYEILKKINVLRGELESLNKIASIRYTINTEDKFYSEEHDYLDDVSPVYSGIVNRLYKSLLESEFRSELENMCGEQLFNIVNVSLKTFSPDIVEDLKKENQLVSKYVKLIASAKINYDGEERNIAGMAPFMQSANREVRKSSYDARLNFFENNENELDTIFDDLVKVRTKIAKKLGYENFVQLGYDRLRRTGYTDKDVKKFREDVKEFIVPLTLTLKEIKKQRTGLDELYYYDSEYNFIDGNPTPKGSPEWITGKAKKMYEELSLETGKFMNFMIDHEVMDLYNKKGKVAGGYCTFIKSYDSPFIFANMNGTDHDVKVLTHEAGHAFQAYESRGFEIPEYMHPTLEACEIHSMSMEFITWPWMDLFFEEDTEKFFFSHLSRAINFIPYGVTVDEFQHFVYENPEATPTERKNKWRELETIYLPGKDYEGNDFLSRGGFWFQQGHIFKSPFYYIDYCLAQICALQFWEKCNNDRDVAWKDYLNLCKLGGSKSFLELVKVANINSPFESETISAIVSYAGEWIESVNKEYYSA